MTEPWHRVEKIFQDALGHPPADRPVFLDRACEGDEDLRHEVESLLAADGVASGFMEEAVRAEAVLFKENASVRRAAPRFGSYRVIRSLGSGGMSTVYLAVRDDDQYRKQVAVKLIKRGMDSEDMLRRFRQERQILANLEHPHIARLLDGGTTEDALPYLVMEYITGLPIDRFCDVHRLSVSERLALFRQVCAAVHFAHQNLVVHRDLKPGNILVTPDGEPKLLDFGIAKLLDVGPASGTKARTGQATRVMTPEYASPEQVRGETITTASDVYSLGVLLYQLLTGQRPYQVGDRRPGTVERMVCETPPERPSAAVGRAPEAVSSFREGRPERLRRRLSGDLDNIVLMALRKEPRRRYSSVEQLSRDLERHLTGLPVIARRDTLRYRAAKFVRRHRAGVAVVSLAFIAVLSSAAFAVWQARVAQSALARAEEEKETAEQVTAYLESLFQVVDPRDANAARDVTARELLDQGSEKISTQLSDQPEIQARLMSTIARSYRGLGAYESAGELLREALEIRRRNPRRGELVVNLNDLGKVLYDRGDHAGAEAVFREALDLGAQLPGTEAQDVATSLNGLGTALYRRGDPASAEPALRRALAIQRELHGDEHPEIFKNLHNLGAVLFDKGDLKVAEPMLRQALDMGRKVHGEEHPSVLGTYNNLIRLLYLRHDYRAAEREYRQLLEQRQRLLGDEHPKVAASLNNLAKVLYVQGRDEEALPLYRRALELKRDHLGEDHPSMAVTLQGLGMVLHELGRGEDPEPYLRRAVELRRRHLPPGHRALAEPLVGLGRVLAARGDAAGAAALVGEALEVLREAPFAGAWQRAEAESVLGECLVALGRSDEGAGLLRDGFDALTAELGEDDRRTRQARGRLERFARPSEP